MCLQVKAFFLFSHVKSLDYIFYLLEDPQRGKSEVQRGGISMTDGFLIISSLTCCFRQERHHAINHFLDNITDAQRARVGEGYYCVLTSEGHWKWWNFKYSKKINPKREIWQESLLKGHLDTDLLASHTSRNLICEFPDIIPSIIAAWTDKEQLKMLGLALA